MRRKKDSNGFTVYVDEDGSIMEGSGFWDIATKFGTKVVGAMTSKTAKEIAKKGAEKAFEKGSEKVGTKVGELAADKLDKVMRRKKENKGKEITKILQNDNKMDTNNLLSNRFDLLL